MITITLPLVFACLFASAKYIRTFIKLDEAKPNEIQDTELQHSTFNAHRLCMQSYEARKMKNSFAKIEADENYEKQLNAYVQQLTITNATNTVSMVGKKQKGKLRAIK